MSNELDGGRIDSGKLIKTGLKALSRNTGKRTYYYRGASFENIVGKQLFNLQKV